MPSTFETVVLLYQIDSTNCFLPIKKKREIERENRIMLMLITSLILIDLIVNYEQFIIYISIFTKVRGENSDH